MIPSASRRGVLGAALLIAAWSVEARAACPENAGITLPPGFCATLFADNLGHTRHLAVASTGVVYANSWSGRYYDGDKPPDGGFLIALQDTTGSGRADVIRRFGASAKDGAHGGTGIALYNGAVYAELDDRIVRYGLPASGIVPEGSPVTVVTGLPLTGDHPMHPFAIDPRGDLFVDVASATNACQRENRMPASPGMQPCTELATRGGLWRYDANKIDQTFSAAERFVTGLRNGEGISLDAAGRMFATQHGRDQLSQNWPKLYKPEQGAELPAEELVELKQGADYGWPECYFDGFQKKLVLAPEYGGDGGRAVGVCAGKQAPVAVFPAHWAPNDMLIYNGTQFPPAYRGGAFIAFHGSWNRAPLPQGGYNVVFQPLTNGKAGGSFTVFADSFAGQFKDPGRAEARPTGLAVGPDGALYIADDVRGRIWRVTYSGSATAAVAAASAPPAGAAPSSNPLPPEGIHPDAGRPDPASLPVPKGATKAQVTLGDRVFHGDVGGGTCSGCHGPDAKGSPVGSNLVSGDWRRHHDTLAWIRQTIVTGVPHPANYPGAMPPMGGAPLSDKDVAAVAAYVYAIGLGGK